MAENIVTITDKEKFREIFSSDFAKNEVFIKTKSGNLKVQYLGYADDNIAFRIPRVKTIPDQILVFTQVDNSTIYATLKHLEANEDTFIFLPIKMQIISETRKEDRVNVKEGGGKSILYISNIVSDFAVKTELTNNEKKVEAVRDSLRRELKKYFKYVHIYMISDGKVDIRMGYLTTDTNPIYVPDMKGKMEGIDDLKYRSYMNGVFAKDLQVASKVDILSEMTVLIKYRGYIPIGYIQVNHTDYANENLLSVVNKMAMVMSELIVKNKLVATVTERFIVADISRGGLGVVFKDRFQTRHFRQGSSLSLDVYLPTGEVIGMGTVVRNINFLENGIIKVGLQSVSLEPRTSAIYQKYLDSISAGP